MHGTQEIFLVSFCWNMLKKRMYQLINWYDDSIFNLLKAMAKFVILIFINLLSKNENCKRSKIQLNYLKQRTIKLSNCNICIIEIRICAWFKEENSISYNKDYEWPMVEFFLFISCIFVQWIVFYLIFIKTSIMLYIGFAQPLHRHFTGGCNLSFSIHYDQNRSFYRCFRLKEDVQRFKWNFESCKMTAIPRKKKRRDCIDTSKTHFYGIHNTFNRWRSLTQYLNAFPDYKSWRMNFKVLEQCHHLWSEFWITENLKDFSFYAFWRFQLNKFKKFHLFYIHKALGF